MPSRAAVLPAALAASCLLAGCASGAAPAPPAPMSDADALAYVQRYSEQNGDYLTSAYPNAFYPDATFVTLVDQADWGAAQVECLDSEGILGAVEEGVGYSIVERNDQQLLDLATFACSSRYPADPRSYGVLTEEQAGYAWDMFTGRIAPCIELLGLRVLPAPTREVFVESVARSGVPEWTPYTALDAASSEPELARSRCPVLPDDPYGPLAR